MKKYLFTFLVSSFFLVAKTQVKYPYPVNYFSLSIEQSSVKMAYMDVKPTGPEHKTILLFHGKNFNGYYWKEVINTLAGRGYRVIIPDQVGWGYSDKPDIHYSFHLLAQNNKKLLDSLGVQKAVLIGHSMGGMLATRFALMYPELVEKLVLEDPIGLEDYKTFIPYQSLEELFNVERSATYESYRKYQQGYYPSWKDEYEQYVKAQAASLFQTDFPKTAWANALTYQMIYEQPVLYEFKNLRVPTLLIIGLADNTVVGKALLNKDQQQLYGNYARLGKATSATIPNCKLVELPGIGHIPHIQSPELFYKALFDFL